MNTIIQIYTDGGSRGNPGPAGIGVYITDHTGKKLAGIGKTLGIATNNVAEYTAVIEAYNWVYNNLHTMGKPLAIQFYMDSRLVVSQLNGEFRVKHPEMQRLIKMVKDRENLTQAQVTYTHIPREKNKHADRLVNLALDNMI